MCAKRVVCSKRAKVLLVLENLLRAKSYTSLKAKKKFILTQGNSFKLVSGNYLNKLLFQSNTFVGLLNNLQMNALYETHRP